MREMAKILLVAVLCLKIWRPLVESLQDESWAQRVDDGKQTAHSLQFYFHDTVSGQNPSAVRVAQASDTNKSLTLFGAVMMADDPLTVGPEPSSKLIGRARGLYGSACQRDFGLIMAMNYGFTDGMYNGSSISILGLNSALNPVREMAVVGGTGLFRMARGYAVAKTHWLDPLSGDAIVGYNVTVIT